MRISRTNGLYKVSWGNVTHIEFDSNFILASRRFDWWMVTDVKKDCSAPILRVKQSKKKKKEEEEEEE